MKASFTIFLCGSTKHPRQRQREEDLDLLAALASVIDGIEDGGLKDTEVVAFADMQTMLRRRPEAILSENQRAWATRRAEDLGLSWGDPAKRNAIVPRGRPVPTPEVLRVLPKRPPQRRMS